MRTVKAGVALALVGSFLLAPLAAAGRQQEGLIGGSAKAEAKQPYDKYVIRARDVSTNTVAHVTPLDANAGFAVSGLAAGTYLIELVKDATPAGQGGKIVCTEGPFTLPDPAQSADPMVRRDVNVQCNRPVAAWWLLGAAAAAGLTAGLVAGDDPAPAPVSGAQ